MRPIVWDRDATTTGNGEAPTDRRNASSDVQSTVRNVVTCGIAACVESVSAIARRTALTGSNREPSSSHVDHRDALHPHAR